VRRCEASSGHAAPHPPPEGEGCRIRGVIEGGYGSPLEQWPAVHAALAETMARLEKAMRVAGLPLLREVSLQQNYGDSAFN